MAANDTLIALAMPIPSPFHERTSKLCTSYRWKDWSGYAAVASYDSTHEREYFAFRESAGLLDVSPLFKYEVYGPDAAALLSRMMVRDVAKLKVGRVGYSCWCDDYGKVIDDGTVARLDEDYYRVTAADPSLHWLQAVGRGMRVTIEDSSARLAVVALQGPRSREILRAALGADGAIADRLKFFGAVRGKLDGLDVWITRTGYTGDLGYEVWTEKAGALRLWDALVAAGQPHGIEPAGLDALDVSRIEAGFILLGVDYFSAPKVILESRKSTPFELGLGWIVDFERSAFPTFIGREALAAEALRLRRTAASGTAFSWRASGAGRASGASRAAGPAWALVGLEVAWEALEALYESFSLPPSLPATARRDGLPVYDDEGRQVGKVTSHTWSPILKKYIALTSVHASHAAPGTVLQMEHTVEFERRKVPARVTKTPFFDPERKKKP
ncbi:MAG TPA: aminomethyltransferase family protein [Thermoanaerobaculia bacterium]|nr:aminomethyltransferase family protein [Thermoanaerobaculia bacterium]